MKEKIKEILKMGENWHYVVVQSKIYKEFFFLVFWEENPP